MKKLLFLLFLPLFFLPHSAYAAIARDSNLATQNDVVGVSNSFSFTNTAGNFLIVPVYQYANGNSITGITYGGVALTEANQIAITSGELSIWYLKSPATGANTLTASFTGGTSGSRISVSSYSGVLGGLDNSTTNTSTAASPYTTTITVKSANSWTFLLAQSGAAITAGSGSSFRASDSGADGRFTESYDSNSALAAGSQSMSVTHAGSTLATSVMISFSPTLPVPKFALWQFFGF